MIRLLGAITGSALALAALLVFVGVPQFKAKPAEQERAVVTLPIRVEEPPPPAPDPQPEAAVDTAAEVIEEPLIDLPEIVEEPLVEYVEPLTPDTLQWYAFWSPFRSEIAAQGFVDQLQRVTGLDYRVVKIKPGVYEVAFGYADDADIPDNLSQISAATGLDMPEG